MNKKNNKQKVARRKNAGNSEDARRTSNQNMHRAKKSSSGSNRSKNSHKGSKILGKVIVVILAILIILTTIFVIRMSENGWTYGGLIATFLGHDSKTVDKLDTVYIVVTGESQNLTDTIMVCAYNPKSNKLSMVSIPRDTYTGKNKNKATASDKINTLYSKSPETLVKKINEITGMNIKYYVNVDTKGLRDMVDAVGGIYFDVPIDMDYDDPSQNLHIHLKAGYQLLDGNKAEQLVRFRHNNDGSSYPASYGDNDLGRMHTQREFIKELMKQIKSKHLILNLSKYVDIAKKNVETNVNLDDMIHYVPYLVDFNLEDLDSSTLPGEPEKCNGVWLFIPNKTKVKTMVEEKFYSLSK